MSEYFDSPREWGTLGTMNTWMSNYHSPDKHRWHTPDHLFAHLSEIPDIENTWERVKTDKPYHDWIREKAEKNAIILPVYVLQHGNIMFNTTGFQCPWDSGLAGFIYATKEDIRNEFEVKRITKSVRQKVEKILADEVNLYSKWASGEMDEEYVMEMESI